MKKKTGPLPDPEAPPPRNEFPTSQGPGNTTARGVILQVDEEDDEELNQPLEDTTSLTGSNNSATNVPVPDYNRMLAERRARVLQAMREGIDNIIVKENVDIAEKEKEKEHLKQVNRHLERLRKRGSASQEQIKATQEEMKRERQKTMAVIDVRKPTVDYNKLTLADMLEMDYMEESRFWDIKMNVTAQKLRHRPRSDVTKKPKPTTDKSRQPEAPTAEVRPGYCHDDRDASTSRIPGRPKDIEDSDIADYVKALENVVQSDIKTLLDNGSPSNKKTLKKKLKQKGAALPSVDN